MTREQNRNSGNTLSSLIRDLEENPNGKGKLLSLLLPDGFLQLPSRMDRMESDISGLKSDVIKINRNLDYLNDNVSTLMGEREERKIASRIHSVIAQPLGLRRARVILSIGEVAPRDLLDPIEDARDEDRISEEQFSRILNTDMVFTARRRRNGSTERDPIWCAVEISMTVRDDDVVRARETADALTQAVGGDTLAIVSGPTITDEAQYMLDGKEVMYAPSPLSANSPVFSYDT